MRMIWALAAAIYCAAPLAAQPEPAAERAVVFTEHPRLLLRPARLKLLRRERERASERWTQFDALVRGGAALPEPGFALALYYRASGDAATGRRAVEWALGEGNDLRQMVFVYDWCQELLSDAQKAQLTQRITGRMAALAGDSTVAGARSRALAAVALYDDAPEVPQRELKRIVGEWWEGNAVPALKAGRDVIRGEDVYPLLEMLHVIRDNTNVDLRESLPAFFADFPTERLMSYYPGVYTAPENGFRIDAQPVGAPDLRRAALSRAADLALAAYDTNAPEVQPLQGWLMRDTFMLRGAFGAPYEFLWANPYHPGLTYNHLALVYHDALLGKLFARSSWEDSAVWFGYFDGAAQKFENGRAAAVDLSSPGPVEVGPALVYSGRAALRFRATVKPAQQLFVIALEPRRAYRLSVEGEKSEVAADPGGILEVKTPAGKTVQVTLEPAETRR